MADQRSWWQRLTDNLPWNQPSAATKAREREELEAAILGMDTEPAPPAASAAEAMADMKKQSRAKRAKPSADDPSDPPAKTPTNTKLHDQWRASGKDGPSEADKDALKRNRGA